MPNQSVNQELYPNGASGSDEHTFTIDEIIGRAPGWILRSGMTVLFIVVAVGIAMTFVIRYPDQITAAGVVTTADPFKAVVTRITGVVDTVFVSHNQFIDEYDPIIYVHNTADRQDIIKCMDQLEILEGVIDGVQPGHGKTILQVLYAWNDDFSLGPLQNTFASLNQQVQEFQHFLQRDDYSLQLIAIDKEIDEINNLNKVLKREKELTEKEVSLSKKDVDRNQELYDHGIISEREMERGLAGHIRIKKDFLLKDNNLAQNRIRIARLIQQKTDILSARKEQKLLYQSRIGEIILNLENQYRRWKLQYFIEAPAGGRILLSSDLVAGQTLPAGKTIGFMIPDLDTTNLSSSTSNPKFAKVFVPSTGYGKIQKGNQAIIRLNAYPYKEYGTISSRVENIYPIAEVMENGASIYEVHLPLDSILQTDYGYQILYTPEMPVGVTIIVEERSLFSRIFDQFLNLLNQHTIIQNRDDTSSGQISLESDTHH